MELHGQLINVRRYSFEDKQTKEIIKGCKVTLAADDDDRNTLGKTIQEVSGPYELYSDNEKLIAELLGQEITLVCDVRMRGKNVSFRAKEFRV